MFKHPPLRVPGPGARNQRAALVRPAILLTVMAAGLGASAFWVDAQGRRAPVPMAASAGKTYSLRDLPDMVAEVGRKRAAQLSGTAANSRTGQGGYLPGPGLVEVDLTPNSPSDERDPVFSPGGDFIAFISNGADSNKDGRIESLNPEKKYHVWVMSRDGSGQRQVTGLYGDRTRDQRKPTWSPDGNFLAYVDSSGPVNGGGTAPQLFVCEPLSDRDTTTPSIEVNPPEQRTFFAGDKVSVAWAPTGLALTFASNANLDGDPTATGGQFDLFSISPDGNSDTLLRLTGGAADPGGRTANDLNPAYSLKNPTAIYYSSNREQNTRLAVGRRIWVVASNGTGHRQITDPVARGGKSTDHDERPSLSLNSTIFDTALEGLPKERLAFQTNSRTDASDTAADGADRNVWQMEVDSEGLVPPTLAGSLPTLVVSNYGGGTVQTYNAFTREEIGSLGSTVDQPEGVWIEGRTAYVANSANDRIEKYDLDSGNRIGGAAFASGGGLDTPAGITGDGTYLYVAGGTGGTTRTAIYRYRLSNGSPAGTAANSAAWSTGETPAGTLTGRCEGITFGPDANGDGRQDLYISLLTQRQVNVYDGATGKFINVSVNSTQGLNFPTGVAFHNNQLYVASSQGNRIFAFDVDATGIATPRATVPSFGNAVEGVDQPEGVVFADLENDGTTELYVSSYGGGFGTVICRYNPETGTPVDSPTSAVWLDSPLLEGAGYFAFDDLALAGPVAPTPTPVPGTQPPVETSLASSSVVTNYLSSPARFAASLLKGTNAYEDKTADIEPAFGRESSVATYVTSFAFSSGRRFAPSPSPSVNGAAPTPAMFNPYGGKELNTNGTAVAPAKTHDIWVTSALDTTYPALVPQGSGNQIFPLMAPGPQAPFRAPRTFEQGLNADSFIKIALVLREAESGLNSDPTARAVTVSFSDADKYRFTFGSTIVNESTIDIEHAIEEVPANIPAFTSLPLVPYDDGACVDNGSGGCKADDPDPAKRVGGHERQAGAIAGDGNYYCESDAVKAPVKTPGYIGDFYMDVDVRDNQGNAFTYDKVWGFSTRPFQKGNNGKNDLFVSDYTVGQTFPALLNGDPRFDSMIPVESYWLDNPGGTSLTSGPPENISTFINMDVWRILCRGAVTQDVLNTYRPRVTQQVDPSEDASVSPRLTKKTRNVAVAETIVVWASPYTGTVFSGPGTLYDAETQRRLTNFLDGGGRLFVSGREVIYSLSNQGTTNNTFLEQELRSKFNGEASNVQVNAVAGGKFTSYGGDFDNLQFPERIANPEATYLDSALNLSKYMGFATRFDLMAPVPDTPGVTVIPAYNYSGSNVGIRVERTRANGLQSRLVFFSFGFEAVNRRYTKQPGLPFRLDMRYKIATTMLKYFKTGSASGNVRSDATNLPVSDFLIEITGNGGPYYVRTDKNGDFQVDGLPSGGFTARPVSAPLADTIEPNNGFYGGTGLSFTVDPGLTTSGLNFRVIQRPPGSLSGTLVTSNATPANKLDDPPAANVPVLVRSIAESSIFKGGGKYAALTRTNASGLYSIPQVPANVPMEVIFNPETADIPQESGLRAGYAGPSRDFGRRLIPDAKRPATGNAEIAAPEGDNYVINDGEGDLSGDNGRPIILPVGPAIAGRVLLEGAAQAGVTVTLSPVSVPEGAPTPDPVQTGPLGYYRFEDITPGTWRVSTTVTFRGASLKGQRDVVVVLGPDLRDRDVEVFAPRITGVVKNQAGQLVSGAAVSLRLANGDVPPFARQATSNASGAFSLWYIQEGSYQVVGSKGSLTGDSGSSPIVVTAFANSVSPDVILRNPDIYGRVLLNGTPAGSASVELLDGNGNSFTPARITTTGNDGFYGYANPSGGSYRIRASKSGVTKTTTTFTVPAGANPQRPDINLYLQRASGTVVKSDLSPASGASVVVTAVGGASYPEVFTNASGAYTVPNLPPGNYVARATLGNTTGQQAFSIAEGSNTTVARIVLESGNVGTGNYDVLGRTYAMSVPWEDTNSPSTNNSGANPATTFLPSAFTEPLKDPQNRTNFVLQRFDPVTRQFIVLGSGDTLRRGEGYLLGVVSKPVSLVTPAEDSTRIPLNFDGATGKSFTFTLRFNPSVTSDSKNGLNLIGFPFDPAKVSSADWASARVTWPGAPASGPDGKPWTVTTAAAAGKMSSVLSTINPSTGSGETSNSLKPFVGYYATAKVDNLQVTVVAKQ